MCRREISIRLAAFRRLHHPILRIGYSVIHDRLGPRGGMQPLPPRYLVPYNSSVFFGGCYEKCFARCRPAAHLVSAARSGAESGHPICRSTCLRSKLYFAFIQCLLLTDAWHHSCMGL